MDADAESDAGFDWDDVSWVSSSCYRREVLRSLDESPATPSKLAADLDIDIGPVSRALTSGRDRGLTELLVSESRRKGRIYGITERGKRALSHLDEEVRA